MKNFVILFGLSLLLHGCAPLFLAAGAGAGGALYMGDKVEEILEKDVSTLYNASLKVIRENKLELDKNRQDAISAVLEGSFADEKKYSIVITKLTEKTATLIVRVGPFLNKDRAQLLMNQIKKEIGKS